MVATAKRRPRHSQTGIPLPRSDRRTIASKRFGALVRALEAELGKPSEAEKALVAQTAAIQIQCEEMQRAILEGCDIDTDQLIRLSSEHRRLMVSLRIKAEKNRPTGPTLAEYLASKQAARAADAEAEEA